MGNANGNMEMLKSNGEELRNDYETPRMNFRHRHWERQRSNPVLSVVQSTNWIASLALPMTG